MIEKRIRKKLKKLAGLVSRAQGIPKLSYKQDKTEHKDDTGKVIKVTSKRVLGTCEKDMYLYLCEEYEAERLTEDMIKLFIDANRRK